MAPRLTDDGADAHQRADLGGGIHDDVVRGIGGLTDVGVTRGERLHRCSPGLAGDVDGEPMSIAESMPGPGRARRASVHRPKIGEVLLTAASSGWVRVAPGAGPRADGVVPKRLRQRTCTVTPVTLPGPVVDDVDGEVRLVARRVVGVRVGLGGVVAGQAGVSAGDAHRELPAARPAPGERDQQRDEESGGRRQDGGASRHGHPNGGGPAQARWAARSGASGRRAARGGASGTSVAAGSGSGYPASARRRSASGHVEPDHGVDPARDGLDEVTAAALDGVGAGPVERLARVDVGVDGLVAEVVHGDRRSAEPHRLAVGLGDDHADPGEHRVPADRGARRASTGPARECPACRAARWDRPRSCRHR